MSSCIRPSVCIHPFRCEMGELLADSFSRCARRASPSSEHLYCSGFNGCRSSKEMLNAHSPNPRHFSARPRLCTCHSYCTSAVLQWCVGARNWTELKKLFAQEVSGLCIRVAKVAFLRVHQLACRRPKVITALAQAHVGHRGHVTSWHRCQ